MRAYRVVWWLLWGPIAFVLAIVGLWLLPGVVLTAAALSGVLAICSSLAMQEASRTEKEGTDSLSRSVALHHAAAVAAIMAVGVGVLALAPSLLVPLSGCALVTSPWLVARAQRRWGAPRDPTYVSLWSAVSAGNGSTARPQPPHGPLESSPLSRDDRGHLEDPASASAAAARLASLSDVALCAAWQSSLWQLQAHAVSVSDRARIVTRRQGYVDEMERRNPHGIAGWLDSNPRAASNPAKFLAKRVTERSAHVTGSADSPDPSSPDKRQPEAP